MVAHALTPHAPPTRRPNASPLVDTLHGHPVADPYRWLEDADDPRTVAWSQGAGRTLRRRPAHTWPGQEHVRRRVSELVGAGIVTVPVWRGDRQFVMRRTAEQEHAVLLVIEADGTERTLIDPMEIDASGTTTLDTWQPSKEGHLLAYQLSEGGTEESVLRVMDVTTGETVDGPIDRARYSPGRLAARRRVLLLRATPSGRPGARGRGAVPPQGLAAPRRHRRRHRHPRLR